MYSALFLFQAALQMALFFWLWRLWRERGAVVAAVLLVTQFGLVWDNLIVGAGRFIGLGPVLEALSWIGGTLPDRSDSESTRTVGRLLSELAYPDQERLSDTRLLDFLRESLARCASIGRALQQQYSLA